MEIVAATNTLICLVISLTLLTYKYKYRIFLHPSFWFFAIWILSVISFLLYMIVGLDYILFSTDKLVELFNYISFTAICICIVGLIYSKKTNYRRITWRPTIDINLFLFLSRFLLFLGLIMFLVNSGIDMSANRAAFLNEEADIALSGQSLPVYKILLNLFIGLNLPLMILSGYFIGRYLTHKKSRILRKEYFFPVILAFIQTVQMGGRAGIVNALIIFGSGLFIGLFSFRGDFLNIFHRLVIYAVILFISFSFFATSVNAIREGKSYESSRSVERWKEFTYLAPFSGILQYMTDHYPGYQLRRSESEIKNPEGDLEWGQNTFSGFFSYNLPGISQLANHPISIQSVFNLKESNTTKGNIDNEGNEWAKTTCTVYYLLYLDFGYYGVFIITFLFILFSQYIFNQLFYTKKHSMFYILPFILVYQLWAKTIFSHHLTGNWLAGPIYIFLIMDFINYLYKRKLAHESTVVFKFSGVRGRIS